MPYSVKGFFEIDEDMVQILLVLEVLFTQVKVFLKGGDQDSPAQLGITARLKGSL